MYNALRIQHSTPKFTKVTLNHGEGNVKICGFFFERGVGSSKLIEVNMDQIQYKNILEDRTLLSAVDVLPVSTHFSRTMITRIRIVKKFLTPQSVFVLDCPDLNPIDYLWCEV